MKFTDYKGYQITTELYGFGYTWMYRHNPGGWVQQPLTKARGVAKIVAYSTREMAIHAAKEIIDKL